MPYGLDDPQPQVWCGCKTRMELDPTRKPHGFMCPNCGGCVDVIPPIDHWEWHKCGAVHKGVRCLEPVPRGAVVCIRCEQEGARDLAGGASGRKFLIDLLGGAPELRKQMDAMSVMERAARRFERETAEKEKREAKRRQRESEVGYVVYYVRVGPSQVKIGTTNNLPRRMKEHRVVNRDNVLAAEPGGFPTEKRRHEQFKKWRWKQIHKTEDFAESPDLLAHIKATRAEHGDPYQLAARLHQEPKAA